MDRAVYRQFYEQERDYWWFVGMRRICYASLTALRDLDRRGSGRCLDVGCGTGLWTKQLEGFGQAIGLDMADEALDFCRRRGIQWLVRGSAERLPIATQSCDLITALGLIEHVDDDGAFVKELSRACKPGGYVLLLTSAYRQLWSEHDDVVHHKRRYTKAELARLLQRDAFDVVKLTYVNSFLLPVIVGFRWIRVAFKLQHVRAEEGTPDIFTLNPIINGILTGLLVLESWIIRVVNLPCGVGLLAVARRRPVS